MDEQYYRVLLALQETDFVLIELNLYLDTHPWDHTALHQFNEYSMRRQQIAAVFEQAYGPLKNFGQSPSPGSWRWSQPPWPWQV